MKYTIKELANAIKRSSSSSKYDEIITRFKKSDAQSFPFVPYPEDPYNYSRQLKRRLKTRFLDQRARAP